MADDLFVDKRHELDGILVGGPSTTKDEFLDGDYLHHELQDKVLGKFDVAYTDESGLKDLVDNASEARSPIRRSSSRTNATWTSSSRTSIPARRPRTASIRPVENLIMGSVDRLLISEDLRSDVVVYECPNGHEEYEVVDSRHSTPSHECSECGEEADVDEREDVIEHLMSIAEQRGTDTKFISTDFEKGEQLLDAFGGIAGILRYSTGV